MISVGGGGLKSGDYIDQYEAEYSHKCILLQSSATQHLIIKKGKCKYIAHIKS